MRKLTVIKRTFALMAVLSASYTFAVQPVEIRCGDGATVEVSDSAVHLADAACLKAGHPPQSQAKPTAEMHKVMPTAGRKIVRIRKSPQQLGSGAPQTSSIPDHSDFILLAQGCECISPNCVAYSCPADAEVP